MMKKTLVSIFSLMLVVVLFCSCSAFQVKNVSVVATVNGEDILTEEYNYYLLLAKESILSNAGATADSEEFWKTTDINGTNAGELAKQNALDEAVKYTLLAQKAKAMGFSADSPEAKEQISAALTQNSQALTQFGISKESFKSVLEKLYLESALYQSFQDNDDIDMSEEALKKVYEEKYRTVKHILYSYTDPTTGAELYDQATLLNMAEKTISQIKSGEYDFDTVMKTASMDPGLASSPDGYTFTTDGSMAAPFEEVAFTLEIGEMSEPVLTNFGYHILKREALIPFETYIKPYKDKDQLNSSPIAALIVEEYTNNLINELKADSTIEKNEKIYNKISL